MSVPVWRLSRVLVVLCSVATHKAFITCTGRPARRLSRALVVLCSVATSKAFITCTFSMQCFDRPARCVSRALFVLCNMATSKAFITCNCSFYAVWRPARRLSHVLFQCSLSIDQQGVYHMYRSFCRVSIDQKGVYRVYMFYAVSQPERVFITCTVRCICRFRTSKVFTTCTCCSIQFLDQQGVSHLHWPVTALCCVLRQHGGWRLFTLFDTNKQANCITRSSPSVCIVVEFLGKI